MGVSVYVGMAASLCHLATLVDNCWVRCYCVFTVAWFEARPGRSCAIRHTHSARREAVSSYSRVIQSN
jgi:hypothetical protein